MTDCEDGSIRLTGSNSSLNGRLEICKRKVWGTVCGAISNADANVVCRMLGQQPFGKQLEKCVLY